MDVFASIVFPLRSSVIQQPLCSSGSLRPGSPPSLLIRAAPTWLGLRPRASGPASLRERPYSLREWSRRPSRSPSFPSACGTACAEATGSPRFLGGPPCARALLYDPGGPFRAGHRALPVLPSSKGTESASTTDLSGLHHTAQTLPVYASQSWSPFPTQDSVPTAGQLCRAGSYPLGPSARFQVLMSSVPLAQASPGALPSILVNHSLTSQMLASCATRQDPFTLKPTLFPQGIRGVGLEHNTRKEGVQASPPHSRVLACEAAL